MKSFFDFIVFISAIATIIATVVAIHTGYFDVKKIGESPQNNPSNPRQFPVLKTPGTPLFPTFPVASNSLISRQAAVEIVQKWLRAKKVLFAPPFNRQLGTELTIGEAYRKNIGPGSSLEWLQNNNAYYRYGVQRLDNVESFVASGDQATIKVVITEDRKYYLNGTLITDENTAFDTQLATYSLQLENGQLKISDYYTHRK